MVIDFITKRMVNLLISRAEMQRKIIIVMLLWMTLSTIAIAVLTVMILKQNTTPDMPVTDLEVIESLED